MSAYKTKENVQVDSQLNHGRGDEPVVKDETQGTHASRLSILIVVGGDWKRGFIAHKSRSSLRKRASGPASIYYMAVVKYCCRAFAILIAPLSGEKDVPL